LELLRLESPGVTDDGMAVLTELPSLRFIHLLDARLTDAGLVHLHQMERLESLYLDRVQVTDEGLEDLLQALPNLHVHIDDAHPHGQDAGHTHRQPD
jgi:hypothetical protein